MDYHTMPGSGSKSVYALLGIAGALVGEKISDVLGYDFPSFGSALGTILGTAFFIIGWRQLQPPWARPFIVDSVQTDQSCLGDNQRMSSKPEVATPANGITLRPIPMIMFGSRWLQLPLYLGLIIAQGVYVVLFLKELWHLTLHSFDFSEQQIMLVVLGLIDVVMISNLLLMVIVGGYETFVSRMNLAGHPDEPEWLSHVNAGVLKIKLAMAIIGISSIHLLRTFIEAGNLGDGGRATDYTEAGVMWQTIIHVVFIISAVGIAYVDRISNGMIDAARTRNDDRGS
jgi:uncharacterized protein (TIGR00645 family)